MVPGEQRGGVRLGLARVVYLHDERTRTASRTVSSLQMAYSISERIYKNKHRARGVVFYIELVSIPELHFWGFWAAAGPRKCRRPI